LSDYIGVDKHVILGWDNDQTREAAEAMWLDASVIFESLGIRPYRVDYTGNGIAAFVKVAYHQRADVEPIRRAHAALVQRFNNIARHPFADPKVKDAGSRIMRIPFGENVKVADAAHGGVMARRTPANLHTFDDAPGYNFH